MDLSQELRSIIEEEEKVLSEVLVSLYSQHRVGSDQFRINARDARELTSQIVAASRAEDKQQLASDEAVAHGLSKLRKGQVESVQHLLESPYFARIVVVETSERGGTKTIEYKIGTRANVDCRIIDWRAAPISKLYYEYKEGDDYCEFIQGRERVGKVLLRRRIDIKDGLLERISTAQGDLVKSASGWSLSSAATRKRSRGALPDVLSLITKDQFRTITEDAETAVLIQGVAGSGKTTVALYRLAWLLSQPSDAPLRAAIVVRSPVLRSYIKAALPKLNLENVPLLTYREWLSQSGLRELGAQILDSADLAPGVQRLKQSMALLNVLEEYVQSQIARLLNVFDETLQSATVNDTWRQQLRHTRTELELQKIAPVPAIDRILTLVAVSDSEREVSDRFEKVKKRLQLYREDLVRILQSPDEIVRHDDTGLLDREIVVRVREFTDANLQRGVVDEFDLPLLLRLFTLKQGGIHVGETDRGVGRLDYLVSDEVQDFSPVEIATMVGSVRSLAGLTLVGDEAQAVHHESAFPGWEKLRARWNLGKSLSRFVSLQVSFRSSGPIMRLADHVLGENRSHDGRPGSRPVLMCCRSEEQAIRELALYLSGVLDKNPGELIAVLCASRGDAKDLYSLLEPTMGATVRIGDDEHFEFEEGVVVTEIAKVKGLEFTTVVLWNPTRATYPAQPLYRRMLYVAVTRAEENVAIVSWEPLSPLLPNQSSAVYDYVVPEDVEGPSQLDGEELFDPYPRGGS